MPIMRLTFQNVSVVLACAAAGLVPSAAAQSNEPPVAPAHRERVLRSWDDSIKVDGQDVLRHVVVIFDYTDGAARLEAQDLQGRLLSREALKGLPRPSAEEIAEAISIIEADAQLARVVQRIRPFYEGGFVLSEAEGFACGPGTRCLQIRLAPPGDHMGTLRWVAVDLVRQRIAYRNLGAVERERLVAPFQEGQP
jgi:hypothetical protein